MGFLTWSPSIKGYKPVLDDEGYFSQEPELFKAFDIFRVRIVPFKFIGSYVLTSSRSLPGLVHRVHMPFLPSLQLCFTTRRMNFHHVRLRFHSPYSPSSSHSLSRHDECLVRRSYALSPSLHPCIIPFHLTTRRMIVCRVHMSFISPYVFSLPRHDERDFPNLR